MITMCSNQAGTLFGYLAGRYPGLIGNLFSTDGKFTPWRFAEYALDNGAFPCWTRGIAWDESAWLKLLDRGARCPIQPRWGLVKDVVADKAATLESWEKYKGEVVARGFTLAFAVQDGMTVEDVPADAEVIFVGGSTDWKWATLPMWCNAFPRVHVGRVNEIGQLRKCFAAGAESTDGTGWFRGDDRQLNGLIHFLDEIKHKAGEPTRAKSYFKYQEKYKQERLF